MAGTAWVEDVIDRSASFLRSLYPRNRSRCPSHKSLSVISLPHVLSLSWPGIFSLSLSLLSPLLHLSLTASLLVSSLELFMDIIPYISYLAQPSCFHACFRFQAVRPIL
jgi:hypothetical protein